MKNKPIYVGLHVQKCAGTTLQMHIAECPRASSWFWHTSPDINYQNSSLEIEERNTPSRNHVKVLWGHAVFGYFLRFFVDRPVYLFTFLRNPAERIISWYKYEAREYEKARGSMEGFDSFDNYVIKRQNHMCRFILNRFSRLDTSGSKKLHERTISVLEKFAFVGVQEHFQEGANNLLEFMDLPKFPDEEHKKNVDDGKIKLQYDSDLIAAHNISDAIVYEYAMQRYATSAIPDPTRVIDPSDYGYKADSDCFKQFIKLRGRGVVDRLKSQKMIESYKKDNLRKIAYLLTCQCFAENDKKKQEFYQEMLYDFTKEFNFNLSQQEIDRIPSTKAIP
jgi:hypothetical protein